MEVEEGPTDTNPTAAPAKIGQAERSGNVQEAYFVTPIPSLGTLI
jgi:hypothetical protein